MVVVPDISSQKNKSFEAAYNELRGKGLIVGNQSCVVDPAHVDMVVSQNPVAGTSVAPGAEIAVSMGAQLCHINWPRWEIINGVITRRGMP
jgi:beta-lactam-binding protein with PASTA domain